MKKYRFWKRAVAVLLAGYFVGGFASFPLPNRELFPVFSWLLFAETPGTRTAYGLRFTAAGGVIFPEPVPHTQAYHLMLFGAGVSGHQQIQLLGRALEENNADAVATSLEQLEGMFTEAPLTFQLVRETFDPIEKWKSGAGEIEVIREFQFDGPLRLPREVLE